MLKIKPLTTDNPRVGTKRVTLTLGFQCWNALMQTGEPKQILESLVMDWYRKYLDNQESYVVSSHKPISNIDLGLTSNSELLMGLREDLARAEAMGRVRKAQALRVKIAEVERDLLLAEKMKSKDSAE